MYITSKLELQDCLLNSHRIEGEKVMMHSENSRSEEGRDE